MALIDSVVRSGLFFHSARALVLSYSTIATSHYAKTHPKGRLERVIQQTMTTCFASLTLEALPLAALEGTLISAALPWAPVVFAVAALGTAYFAPDKTHLPLQAIEITVLALAILAALAAPSTVTLGTLGVLSAVWFQMREIPYLSATIDKVMKAAGGALSAVGLLWALKESLLTFKIQYALYALLLGAISLYVAHKKAKKAERVQENSRAQEAPQELPSGRSQELETCYKNHLKKVFIETYKKCLNRDDDDDVNTDNLFEAISFKWLSRCTPEVRNLLTSELSVISDQTKMPDAPVFNSLREEWVYGTYTHSANDPKDLMSFLYSTFGKDFSVERLLEKVHQQTMTCAITDYLENQAERGVSDENTLYAQAFEPGKIITEALHLYKFAEGLTLFGSE